MTRNELVAAASRRYKASPKGKATYARRYAMLKASGVQQERNHAGYAKEKLSGQYDARHLKRKFGMTLADYDRMEAAQNAVCAICDKPNTHMKRLCVDHDHETGSVRLLLCTKCNRSLGTFEKNLKSFTDYLAKFKG